MNLKDFEHISRTNPTNLNYFYLLTVVEQSIQTQ